MAVKYTHIYHCKTLQSLPKAWLFGLKISHLATLVKTPRVAKRGLKTKMFLLIWKTL
jgi:hypothetical protein